MILEPSKDPPLFFSRVPFHSEIELPTLNLEPLGKITFDVFPEKLIPAYIGIPNKNHKINIFPFTLLSLHSSFHLKNKNKILNMHDFKK